jgi:hypothetical protein
VQQQQQRQQHTAAAQCKRTGRQVQGAAGEAWQRAAAAAASRTKEMPRARKKCGYIRIAEEDGARAKGAVREVCRQEAVACAGRTFRP